VNEEDFQWKTKLALRQWNEGCDVIIPTGVQ